MRVLLTGATGFVGSHAVPALRRAGHELRLLVRSREKTFRVLGTQGEPVPETVVGDMTDAESVAEALDGCDAVVHAAAVMFGSRSAWDANRAGFRNVVEGGRARGLDPVVYVSTVSALFPPQGPVIRADDPVGTLTTPYGRSKIECERRARVLQDEGAPLTVHYPAGVWGPDDPTFGEAAKGLRDGLRFGFPLTTGGVSVVDVRDVAEALAASLEPGRGARRYLLGGHFLPWHELAERLSALTGRRVRRFPAPAPVVRLFGRMVDVVKRVAPFDYPVTYEAAVMMTRFVPCDSGPAERELGVRFRPIDETLADSVRFLHRAGHIPDRLAGRLAAGGAS